MPSGLFYPILLAVVGVLGFALCGYVHVHLAENRRFREQAAPRKRAIVALAFAQWPYMFVGLYGLVEIVRCLV